MNDKTEKSNEEYVMNQLLSRKRDDYVAAVHEIVKRGEKMFDSLLKLKGNKDIFLVAAYLGNHSPSNAIYFPLPEFMFGRLGESRKSDDQDDQYITVEVVALYLISAIYFQRTDFSRMAILRDPNIEVHRGVSNKKENVERAYQSVEQWVEKCKREGIASLREKKIDPLAGSNLKWW